VEDVALAEDIARRGATAIENARLFLAEQRAKEAADLANRTKDDFLANVSHELRTPLNSILGWARLLIGGLEDEAKTNRAATTIERNARAMAQLIDDLLDISRIVSGKLRLETGKVDVALVVENAIESVKPGADAKRIKVACDVHGGTTVVVGDATRLQQIVWNLLSNAVKFTPQNGKVSIAVRGLAACVEIEVADTGQGIAAAFLPGVFDAFRQAGDRATRSMRGLGLGLSISKNLVELHGGTIEADSDGEGRGATFRVRLPLAPRPRAPTPEAAQSAPSTEPLPQLVGLRVLVVEDEPDALEFVCAMLEKCGSVALQSSSVAEALAVLEKDRPDVMLSDIGLPDETGYDLIRHIRALPPDRGGEIPAAALTAYARADDRRKALAAGFMLHVAKPVEPAELATVVATLARYAVKRPVSS
jgi:CheY-like chemotaxis protein/nitrogen-specific signal transduction histidine kinase